jgi:hypothetical protein
VMGSASRIRLSYLHKVHARLNISDLLKDLKLVSIREANQLKVEL